MSSVQAWLRGGRGGSPGAPGLTAFRQHALLHLLQLLITVPEVRLRDLSIRWRVHALPTGHAAVAHSDHRDSKHGMVSRPRARFATEQAPLPSLIWCPPTLCPPLRPLE